MAPFSAKTPLQLYAYFTDTARTFTNCLFVCLFEQLLFRGRDTMCIFHLEPNNTICINKRLISALLPNSLEINYVLPLFCQRISNEKQSNRPIENCFPTHLVANRRGVWIAFNLSAFWSSASAPSS